MKIAEALQERADLNRKIEQLKQRMARYALVQEGETPGEDMDELKQELNGSLDRLAWIIAKINLTNATVMVDGKTLTELIAEKDVLTMRISAYKNVTESAGNIYYRARGSEIKLLPTVSVKEWEKDIDRMSSNLRRIDNLLQETNWSVDLIE